MDQIINPTFMISKMIQCILLNQIKSIIKIYKNGMVDDKVQRQGLLEIAK